ncbi:hypothetical protein SmJEL517_g01148 [Synchytrium microbalum]|uniref:MYND-type domain-containing protein n=1 Tax=Synchytrium microbalum TaxID=1806994 RepID=A0A507CFN7_9FUNG|nr:uncharacterized protein SmJEL517_g01148 [Synchytrium microbalum]TPX36744.1 hypothetical protein SmJEL517_g01148 [Synchytrium microbalum]
MQSVAGPVKTRSSSKGVVSVDNLQIWIDFVNRIQYKLPKTSSSSTESTRQAIGTDVKTSQDIWQHMVLDVQAGYGPVAEACMGLSLHLPTLNQSQDDEAALNLLIAAASSPLLPPLSTIKEDDISYGNIGQNLNSAVANVSAKNPALTSNTNASSPTSTSITLSQAACVFYLLGDFYRRGIGAPANLSMAFGLFAKAAISGSVEAHVALAGMYERGDGIIRDDRAAHRLYLKAALSNSAPSQFKLAFGLERGIGCRVDFYLAKLWYRRAAAQSHFASAVRLAIMSLDPGYETMDVLLEAADKSKTPRSMHDVAVAYSTTRHGGPQDVSKMRKWLQLAARVGHARSQWMMGKIYQDGLGGSIVDPTKAFFWYHKAALQGYQPAQWSVSGMYRSGNGVPGGEPNVVLADKWHKAANRFSCGRTRADVVDFAGLLSYSLDSDKGPQWNALEADRPFNVMIPASVAPTSTIQFKGFEKASNTFNNGLLNQVETGMPPRVPTTITYNPSNINNPNTTNTTSNVRTSSRPMTSVFDIDIDPVAFKDMPSLLRTLGVSDEDSIQERSTHIPNLNVLNRYTETHPSSVLRLLKVKRHFVVAEELLRDEEYEKCVEFLANGFRTWGGLLDTSIYTLRLLFEVAIQIVVSKNPNNVDALVSDMFLNMNTRPVELSWVIVDKCLALKPNDPTLLMFRGDVKARCGLYKDAIQDYDAAEKLENSFVENPVEVLYHRGVCYSNMEEKEYQKMAIVDLASYVTAAGVDGRRTADAQYTLSGLYFLLDNPKKMVEHFRYALEAEAVRLEFMPTIINTDLKTRLTLEVRYTICSGGGQVRKHPWSRVPSRILRAVEGEEPQSVAKQCVACGCLVTKTKTCGGCREARYCGTNCQIAHWTRGHSTECKKGAMVKPLTVV